MIFSMVLEGRVKLEMFGVAHGSVGWLVGLVIEKRLVGAQKQSCWMGAFGRCIPVRPSLDAIFSGFLTKKHLVRGAGV